MRDEVNTVKQEALDSLQGAMDYISSHEGDQFTGLFLCYHKEGKSDVVGIHTCDGVALYGIVRIAALEMEQELLASRKQGVE